MTQSKIKLTLVDEEQIEFHPKTEDEIDNVKHRSSLLYDHIPSVRTPHVDIDGSRALLKQMCSLGFPDIQRGFPDVFTNFLVTAKLLSYSALQQLLARADSICPNGK